MWRDPFQASSGPGAGGPRGVERLVGESEPMRDLKARIPRIAAAPFPLVIEGESGTGKELVARAIHEEGPRGRALFVPVNCAVLGDELCESELYGGRPGGAPLARQRPRAAERARQPDRHRTPLRPRRPRRPAVRLPEDRRGRAAPARLPAGAGTAVGVASSTNRIPRRRPRPRHRRRRLRRARSRRRSGPRTDRATTHASDRARRHHVQFPCRRGPVSASPARPRADTA